MARLFISHSSRNNAEALALHQWLISQGWTDLFLDIHPVDGLAAAEKWQKALRDSIARCRAVIFCLSPEWLESPFCMAEFWGALQAGAAPVGVIVKPLDTETIPAAMTGSSPMPRVNVPACTTPSTSQARSSRTVLRVLPIVAESASISAIQGKESTRKVVEALMSAEQSLQTAVAVRDKVVQAYQEVVRMSI